MTRTPTTPVSFIGTSADQKPQGTADSPIADGSVFFESDTLNRFVYSNHTWQPATSFEPTTTEVLLSEMVTELRSLRQLVEVVVADL